jgi:predicted MFS family arabinose efflux permease
MRDAPPAPASRDLRNLLWYARVTGFWSSALFAILAPLLPALAADLRLSTAEAGLLAGIHAAGTILAAVPAGMLADRFGHRAVSRWGMGMVAVSSLGMAFGQDLTVLCTARLLQGAGTVGAWVGALAWLTSTTGGEERTKAIASTLSAAFLGTLVGPAMGAVAASAGRVAVFCAVGVLAIAVAAWGGPRGLATIRVEESRGGLVALLRRRRAALGAASLLIGGLLAGTVAVLGPLRLHAQGASPAGIAVAFLLARAGLVVITNLQGRANGAESRVLRTMATFMAVNAALFASLSLSQNVITTAACVTLLSVSILSVWMPSTLLLTQAASVGGSSQGLATAVVNLSWAAGALSGSLLPSALADATTQETALMWVAVLCTTAASVMVAAATRHRRRAHVRTACAETR